MPEQPYSKIFSYYEDLIKKGIHFMQEEFYEFSQEMQVGSGENKRTERVYMDGLTPLNWLGFLESSSKNQSRKVLLDIDSILFNATPAIIKNHLSKYYSDLN